VSTDYEDCSQLTDPNEYMMCIRRRQSRMKEQANQLRQQPQGGGISPGMAASFIPEGDAGGTGSTGSEGAGSYVAPALTMAAFIKMAHDEGLIDKNTEVIQDATQGIKGIPEQTGDAMRKLQRGVKRIMPWEWF